MAAAMLRPFFLVTAAMLDSARTDWKSDRSCLGPRPTGSTDRSQFRHRFPAAGPRPIVVRLCRGASGVIDRSHAPKCAEAEPREPYSRGTIRHGFLG
jgi:hypothetical protein